MIEMSSAVKDLFSALSKVQSTIKDAKMDSKNPHFQSKYASLGAVYEACRTQCAAQGICITQLATTVDGRPAVWTMLGHTSGQWIRSLLVVPADKPTAQGMGSALTYGRRYALSAIVGIAADEDDDGNVAETQTRRPEPKQSQPARQTAPAPTPHNPNAAFVFPAGKYKGRDIESLSHDELRGWYHYFADKTAPGETQKGWVGEGMVIARKILDRDKKGFENEVPNQNDHQIAPNELDNIPF